MLRQSSLALVLVVLAACDPVSSAVDGGVGSDAPANRDGDIGVDADESCDPACGDNATCSAGSCACDDGYMGDGQTCTDADECLTDNGGCDPNADCTNTEGSRTCACPTGWEGDGETCVQRWALVQTFADVQFNPDSFGGKATAVGNRIFFGPETNLPGNKYMRSFDTQTEELSGPLALPPAASDDFCACGYTDAFVGDPAGGYVYMLGNYGMRYNVTTNAWSGIDTYSAVARGEAAGAYEGNNNTLFLVGGRGPLNDAARLNVATQTFSTEGGTLPATSSAAAWAPPGNNLTYVAGGDENRRQLLVHATGTANWTSLADAPENLGRPRGMGNLGPRIWVATSRRLHFYNPGTSSWDRMLDVPPGFERAVNAGPDVYAFAQAPTGLEIHRLISIDPL